MSFDLSSVSPGSLSAASLLFLSLFIFDGDF